jgi:uracil-DNA glycosylase family 4
MHRLQPHMNGCPIPGAYGWQDISGKGSSGVLILGEAMGEQEAEESRGFVEWAPAGSVLERAIRRGGMDRDQFLMWNVVPVRPPNNWLEGAPWELEAVAWGKTYLEEVIQKYRPKAILALGGVATRATTGLAGDKLGVSSLTGFVLNSHYDKVPVIPCFHPSYLRRGKMSHFGVLLRAIRLAVSVAREGRVPVLPPLSRPPVGYKMFPNEEEALAYEKEAERARVIAYDIETPYSGDDAAEEAEGVQTIKSIQFSIHGEEGIFLPWRPPFIDVARRILSNRVAKLGWNVWRFDDPLLKSEGCTINGEVHDLMWAWHHLNPDLPRGLQFAAAQSGWPWPWKHYHTSDQQFYGIVDVDVLHFLAGTL